MPRNLRFYLPLPDGRGLLSSHGENAVLIVDGKFQEKGRLQGADFASPEGMAFSKDGTELFVVDRYHNCVHVFDAHTLEYRNQRFGQLNQPVGIAVSKVDGKIWIADNENHRVVALDPETHEVQTTLGKGYGTDPGHLFCPCGVALYSHFNHGELIIVSEWGGNRVQVFKPNGDLLHLFGGLEHAHHVAVDEDFNIYVAEYDAQNIKRISFVNLQQQKPVVSMVATKQLELLVTPDSMIKLKKGNAKRARVDA